MLLYDHNQKAFFASKKMLEEKDKCCIVQATGTGKSYVALALIIDFIEKNNESKVMYIVPSLGVLTEIKCIIKKENLNYLYNNIEFYTYHYISTNENVSKRNNCNLLILDEFHHVSEDAPIWKNSVDQIIENNDGIKVFGMSATPVRESGTSKEEDVCHTFFESNVAYFYSLAEAIKDKNLPIPTYVSTDVILLSELLNLDNSINSCKPIDEIKQNIESLKRKVLANSLSDVFELLKDYLKKDGKYIYFSPPGTSMMKIKSEIEELLNGIDDMDYEIYTVHSDYTLKYNSEVISNFKNSKKNKCRIIISINMLNEGTHIEKLDGVILGRFTKSNQVFYQQIGRALSVYSSQDNPLIIDVVGNLKQMKMLMNEYKIISEKKLKSLNGESENYKIPSFFGIKQFAVDIMDDVETLSSISKNILFKEKMLYVYDYLLKYNEFFDKTEKFADGTLMYDWLKRNKKNILSLSNTNTLANSLSKKLVEMNIFYYHTPTEVFEEKLKLLYDFIKLNHYIPEYNDKNICFLDKTLMGDFLSKNKKYIFETNSTLCNDLKNIILSINPNFSKRNDEIFLEKVRYTLNVIKKLKRVPKHMDTDLKFSDGTLVYAFLRNSVLNFEIYQNDSSVKELVSLIEKIDPNYLIGYEKFFIKKVMLIYDDIFSKRTDLLKDPSLPLVSDKNLYSYLRNHKYKILNSDDENAKKLVKLINEVNGYYFLDDDEKFEEKILEIHKIIETVKFIPLATDLKTLTSKKIRVGLFLTRNKNRIYNSETLAAKKLVELIQQYNPKYFINPREIFLNKVEEFIAYIKENKNLPAQTNTKVLFSDGTQVGRFYSNNKENFEICYNNERLIYLKCLILKIDPYYFLTVKETSKLKFDYIKNYLLSENNLPISSDNSVVFPDGTLVSRFLYRNKNKIYENRFDKKEYEQLYNIINSISTEFFKSTEILNEEMKALNPAFSAEIKKVENNDAKISKIPRNFQKIK